MPVFPTRNSAARIDPNAKPSRLWASWVRVIVSIGDTAQIIAEAIGVPIELISDKERLRPENSEVERLWADNAKSKELFGWQPMYAGREGFMRGLVETIDWFTKAENLHGYKSEIYNV